MKLPVFRLEEFFARREFSVPYLLCSADMETMSVEELVKLADLESRTLWEQLSLGYTETRGHPLLRQEIAKLYPNCTAEDILCFAGAEEGILCAFTAFIEPGDHVIVVTPGYQSLHDLPRTLGAEVTELVLHQENRWELDVDELEKALRSNTRLIILNYPHNPTGAVLPLESFERIGRLAEEHGCHLFVDEVYRLLELDESVRLPNAADLTSRGISLNVLSKSYGLPGLRIGWIVMRDREQLARIAGVKHYASICNSGPSEILALMALRAQAHIFERNYKLLRKNFALLERFMNEHSDQLRWVAPKGSCTAFIELLEDRSVDQFVEDLIEEEGVLVMPGSIFAVSTNHFRIGFGRKNFPEVLQRLARFL